MRGREATANDLHPLRGLSGVPDLRWWAVGSRVAVSVPLRSHARGLLHAAAPPGPSSGVMDPLHRTRLGHVGANVPGQGRTRVRAATCLSQASSVTLPSATAAKWKSGRKPFTACRRKRFSGVAQCALMSCC